MKKLVLIITMIIAGFGIVSDSMAAVFAINPGSAGSLCTGIYEGRACAPRTTYNLPLREAGRYEVSVTVERGNNIGKYECQSKESFYMVINGQKTPVVADPDRCEWSGTVKTQKVDGAYSLKAGNNTIQFFHAHAGERGIGIESLQVQGVAFAYIPEPRMPECGTADGNTFDTRPSSGLCAFGSNSSVEGNGPWNWACVANRRAVQCSANITPAPVCGSSNDGVFDTRPTTGLCSVGSDSGVEGAGPWDWTCTNGARTVDCDANITPAPVCGSADNQTFSATPTTGLCSVGSESSVNGSGPWDWTCTNGARTVSCDASFAETAIQIIKTNGTDGSDSQIIETDADASFEITVTNTGEENLQNVVIEDADASECSRGAEETVALYEGSLLDPGESFSYVCIDTGVSSSYTNTASVAAMATTSSMTVDDSDDSNVVVEDPEEPVAPDPTPDPDPTPTPDPTPVPEPEEEEEDDGAIGNFVWHDRNGDGVQDPGEEGIVGVKLKLYNGNDVETDKTNSRGRYKFKELDPGQYRVVVAEETLPAGCYQTYDKDGKLDNKIKTRIEGDEYYRKADFGYKCPSRGTSITRTSPQTGAGTVATIVSTIIAGLSAGYVYRRNSQNNL